MSDSAKSGNGNATRKTSGNEVFDDAPLPDKIGNSLRSLYDEVLNEDVPDDFLNLLRKADKTSGDAASGKAK
ncbi:MAG: NepR family anti-sigma factor [Pseudomonadota bacterium]